MTRLYLEGRTETVRPVTMESTTFVRAMCNPQSTVRYFNDIIITSYYITLNHYIIIILLHRTQSLHHHYITLNDYIIITSFRKKRRRNYSEQL